MTNDTPANHEASERAADRAAAIIARALAQGLMEAEVIIAADRDAHAKQVPPQLIETLERFSAVLTRLVEFTEQIGSRINELTEAVNVLAEMQAHQPQPQPQPAAKPQLPEMEPSFAPGGEGIDVTIASVPGFQGLMELQRALVRLPQVQSAAVRRYQDDEAAIQLVLAQSMSASAIAEGLTASTGRSIFVDESRPDVLRLRLRFLAG